MTKSACFRGGAAPAAAYNACDALGLAEKESVEIQQAPRRFAARFLRKDKSSDRKETDKSVDLSAYRQLAKTLLDDLLTLTGGDRRRALGILSVRLTALIDDLRSVGADDATIEPLVALRDELAGEGWDEGVLWTTATETLGAFATGTKRKWSFWK